MDKRFILTALAVVVVTAGAAALAVRNTPAEAAPLQETVSGVERVPAAPHAPPQPEEETADYGYILREYEGRVAVFAANDDTTPATVLKTLVKYLPDYDQKQLKEGIQVKDYQDLVDRIEDYTS